MPRSYPYGKVPSSIAVVVSERFERPMVDCGYCSGQMVLRSTRAGIGADGKIEGHVIRAKGGRPHWAGNTSSELRQGCANAYGVNLLGISKEAVLARVRQGYAVAVSLTYRQLPSYLKVQVNDFGHCVMLKGHRVTDGVTYVGYFDPLYEQGSQGSWARWSDVEPALWSTGHSTNTTKYVPPTGRYTLHIDEKASVRVYTGLRKPATGGGPWCIARNPDGTYGKTTFWNRKPSQAPCMAPVQRVTCDGESSATTVLVRGGAFKDKHVRIGGRYGVTVTSTEG
jgi:hypothetical protein